MSFPSIQKELRQRLAVLRLPADADWPQVRKAYRKQVRTWHPDRYQDPWEKMQAQTQLRAVVDAYEWIAARQKLLGGHASGSSGPLDTDPPPVPSARSESARRKERQVDAFVTAIIDGRARIVWGEPPEDVVRRLIQSGVPAPLAEETVAAFVAERIRDFRRYGWRDIGIGSGLVALSAFLHLVIDRVQKMVHPGAVSNPFLTMLILAAACGGGFLLLRGIDRVVTGGKREGPDSVRI